MICSSFEDLLEQYFENTLLPREAATMKLHLDRCPSCAALFEEVRVVDALLLTPYKREPQPNFTFAVMAEARALPAPRPRKNRFLLLTIGYLALAWLAIGLTFVLAHGMVAGTLGTTLGALHRLAELVAALGRVPYGAFGAAGAIVGGVLAFDIVVAGAVIALGVRRRVRS